MHFSGGWNSSQTSNCYCSTSKGGDYRENPGKTGGNRERDELSCRRL